MKQQKKVDSKIESERHLLNLKIEEEKMKLDILKDTLNAEITATKENNKAETARRDDALSEEIKRIVKRLREEKERHSIELGAFFIQNRRKAA